MFAIDNAMDGFDLHCLDMGSYIRTMSMGKPKWRLPKQVAFVEDSGLIIGGSDHGVAYVFHRESGAVMQQLRHVKDQLVQTIAVSASGEDPCLRVGTNRS